MSMFNDGKSGGITGFIKKLDPRSWVKEDETAAEQRSNLNNQGGAASNFADYGQSNYGALTDEASRQRDQFRRLASGQDSLSSEQLRQGLSQNMATQRSMAASASPANAPMASLMAAQNMGRMGAGMSGQAALAGIQERAAANKALSDMILQQRQQDANVALGSRQNATAAYGGITPDKSTFEKLVGPAASAGAAFLKLRQPSK
jgi:hypothetical protein